MFDDNANRATRLTELTTDFQSILADAKNLYAAFLKSNSELNSKLAAVYQKANLDPPKISDQDILAGTDISKQVNAVDKDVRIADVLVDVVGATAMTEMAPAATAFFIDAGLLSEAEAGTALASMLGFDITVGGAVGGIVGVVVVGLVGGAITTAISVFTGQSTSHDLQGGIAVVKQVRLQTEISRDRLRCIGNVVEACKTACDVLMGIDMLDDAAIEGLIKKKAQPALKQLAAIDRNYAIGILYTIDLHRNSWMTDG
jgi:hypothetical protein